MKKIVLDARKLLGFRLVDRAGAQVIGAKLGGKSGDPGSDDPGSR